MNEHDRVTDAGLPVPGSDLTDVDVTLDEFGMVHVASVTSTRSREAEFQVVAREIEMSS